MCDSPFDVYDAANFQGYGFERSGPMGRHTVYGSSCDRRLSLSSFAHGSNGSSPGLRPPFASMSATAPPPTQGPVRSTLPSGSRGIGFELNSDSGSRGLPGLMNAMPFSIVRLFGFCA